MKHYIYMLMIAATCWSCSQSDPITEEQLKQGRLQGQFTVGEDQKVYFSQGNLQYCPNTKVFRFAPDQMTVIGEDNWLISRNYVGYIDLFGSGTGNYPASYGPLELFYQHFVDWGTKPISNGGNRGGIWRSLAELEWEYLAYERPNAEKLFFIGQVDKKLMMILCPDGWTAGSHQMQPMKDSLDWSQVPTYTKAECDQLASEGVVFFPAGGYRPINPLLVITDTAKVLVDDVGMRCAYWLAPNDPETQNGASWEVIAHQYNLFHGPDTMILIERNQQSLAVGMAVRLVQDVR